MQSPHLLRLKDAQWHFFFSFSKPPLTIKGKARMRKCTVMACKLTLKLHRLKHSGFYWAHQPLPSFNGCRCSCFLTGFCFHLIPLSLAVTSATSSACPPLPSSLIGLRGQTRFSRRKTKSSRYCYNQITSDSVSFKLTGYSFLGWSVAGLIFIIHSCFLSCRNYHLLIPYVLGSRIIS